MTSFSPDASSFAKAVLALEPYLGDLVFAGGWAHHLYTLHPEASPVPFEPLRTQDADIAAPLDVPVRGGRRNVTVSVGGVTAQTLRYLDVLLMDPWTVVLGNENGFPLP